MAFPCSAPHGVAEHESLQFGFIGHDAWNRLLSAVAAAPSTGFAPCRTGLISSLLLRCGEGDVAAFEAVMDIFYSVVLAASALELPEEEVETAVHETFVAIWRTAALYRPGGETAVEWVMSHVGTGTPLTARSESL